MEVKCIKLYKFTLMSFANKLHLFLYLLYHSNKNNNWEIENLY